MRTPDLYPGELRSLDEGVAYAKAVGSHTILERGRHAAEGLRSELVYAALLARSDAGPAPGPRRVRVRQGALLFSDPASP